MQLSFASTYFKSLGLPANSLFACKLGVRWGLGSDFMLRVSVMFVFLAVCCFTRIVCRTLGFLF